ncbi:MAG: hypothetical protein QXF01_00710 [Candidatus Micrarchaeaceae archaeon]
MTYSIIPIKLHVANAFIAKYHCHNKPVDHRGHRFSIGLQTEDGELIGVAVAGQPIAQKNDDGRTLEILRVCVKTGNTNANSQLYGRVKVIARLLGYSKIITYTLQSESGSSLKAIGAHIESTINRKSKWSSPARIRKEQELSYQPRLRRCL